MSRQRLLAALAALAVTLSTAACGVPGRSDVVVDRDDNGRDGFVENTYGGGVAAPGPEGAGTVEDFVRRFLEAPGGDWEGAAARVKEFLSPQLAESWQAPKDITVVRLVAGKPEIKLAATSVVTLKVQQIGVLTNRGTLDPPTSQTHTYTFKVGQSTAPRGGLAVLSDPPPVMLLTDTGLDKWYEPRTIYFWDTGRRNLVPDLRYLPKAEDDAARPNLLIDWLIGGPTGWLHPSVQDLPDGTKQLARAYKDNNDRLIVNLNNAATAQYSLDQLLAQLCWSLRDDFTGDVVLQVENIKRGEGSTTDYLDDNPASRPSGVTVPLFAVADGVVRRVKIAGLDVPDDVPFPPGVNKDVRFAAISDRFAALARRDGDRLRLWVGSIAGKDYKGTNLWAHTMSRPVLVGGQDTGYVAADGKLYQFAADPAKVTPVSVSGLTGKVTSVALAPDGRRLAVVAGGKPYLVALSGDGGGSTGAARLVPPQLTDLTGISWLSETSLAMTGPSRGRAALVTASVDGVPSGQQELNAATVTELVSLPEDPVNGGGRVLVEADSGTYEVYSRSITYLAPEELAGPAPAKGVVPTAPFFLE